jgi:ABC-2 type transport system permease protein
MNPSNTRWRSITSSADQTVAIAGRDARAVLGSGFGVGLAAGFAALAGVLVVIDLRGNLARLDQWFAALFVSLGLLAALLTMRSFADEERTGQIELLLTAPVRTWQLVTGKFAGAAAVMASVLAGTAGAPLLVATIGRPDAGPIVTGYVGLVGVGLAFVAIGLAISASTSSSLVSGSGTVGVLLALWFGGLLGRGLKGRPRVILDELSPANHVTGYLRGTLSLNDAVYFVSLIAIGLAATVLVLRWRR